jgi:hypothetical protein
METWCIGGPKACMSGDASSISFLKKMNQARADHEKKRDKQYF